MSFREGASPRTFDNMEDLQAALEEVTAGNETLMKENWLLESYLSRTNGDGVTVVEEESDSRRGRKPRLRATSHRKVQLQLTPEQKVEIASRELEEAKGEISRSTETSEKLLEQLVAVMEETDVHIAEIKKETFEFKRDIVTGAENARTGKTMAEKVVRYMDERLRQKDATIEKLRLKNTTVKAQIRKMELQLSQKEEMGEVLHAIDFHQLEIENKQYLERIEQRNQELLRLKLTTGNTVQVLNSLKKKLSNLTSESEWLKKEIAHRDQMLARIEDDINRVTGEKDAAERVNQQLLRRQRELVLPEVIDYVNTRAESYELAKALKTYKVKVQIAEMTLARTRREAKKVASELAATAGPR